jgi:hypothetical protein
MTAARIKALEAIINPRLISLENGAESRHDSSGRLIVDVVKCLDCGLSWNDALVTERTPAPAGRCPYEYEHAEIRELAWLKARQTIARQARAIRAAYDKQHGKQGAAP